VRLTRLRRDEVAALERTTGSFGGPARGVLRGVLFGLLVAALALVGLASPAWAATTGWALDPTFTVNVGTGAPSTVQRVVRQSGGKILVGGNFAAF
jgi:hypothetical protein